MPTAVTVKPGRLDEMTERELQILDEVLQDWRRGLVAVGLSCAVDSAQLQDRLAARLVWRHAGADVVVDVQLEVALELGVEGAGRPIVAREERLEADQRGAKASHAGSSEGFRKRSRTAVACSQCFVSCDSSFRPVFVIL